MEFEDDIGGGQYRNQNFFWEVASKNLDSIAKQPSNKNYFQRISFIVSLATALDRNVKIKNKSK